MLLRQAHGSKFALREKWAQQIEALLQGQDPTLGREAFWDELFLLKVNAPFLAAQIDELSVEAVMGARKASIRLLIARSVQRLQDEHPLRVQHALQTLTVILHGILRKNFSNYGPDVIDVIAGLQAAGPLFQSLFEAVDLILQGSNRDLRALSLALLLVIATGSDIVNRNALIEFALAHLSFATLLQCAATDALLARDTLALLGLFANYRKTESVNAYLLPLRRVAAPHEVDGIARTLQEYFADAIAAMDGAIDGDGSSGVLSMLSPSNVIASLTGYFYGTPTAATPSAAASADKYTAVHAMKPGQVVRTHLLMLLTLYEMVNGESAIVKAMVAYTPLQDEAAPGSSPLDKDAVNSGQRVQQVSMPFMDRFLRLSALLLQQSDTVSLLASHVTLLTMCSLVSQPSARDRLCSPSLSLALALVQRRKYALPIESTARPLCTCLLDYALLALSFCRRAAVSAATHCAAAALLLAAISALRRAKIRAIDFKWELLWPAVIASLRAAVASASASAAADVAPGGGASGQQQRQMGAISKTVEHLIRVINIAVAFADDFLPTAEAYDHLMYEILRNYEVFEAVEAFVEREAAGDGDISIDLSIVREIRAHFAPHLFESDMTAERILSLLRAHVGSLQVRRSAHIDATAPFAENHSQATFFRQLLREAVPHLRASPIVHSALK